MKMLKRFVLIPISFLFALISSFSYNYFEDNDEPFLVVLDAGHGGHDPGNLGNGYMEKNIALNIVLEVGKLLSTNKDIKVIYTRDNDTFVDLFVRGEIANKANADLFVSVHCDSHTSDANGAGTFVLGLHANKQNFEIAKKENSVIYLEDNYESRYADYDINSPESVIGLTIMQEEFLDQSIMLGKMMQDNFSKKLKRNDRKVKQAGFIVLHQTFMPSVLIETGFLTNKSEGAYLNSKKGQQEMGKAIAEAIITYKNNTRAPSSNQSSITVKKEPEAGVINLPVIASAEKEVADKPNTTLEKEQVGVAVVAATTVENSIEKTVIEKDKELPKQVSDTKTTDEGAVTAMGDDKQQPIKEEPTIQKEEITILSEEKSTAKNDMTSQKDEIVSIKEEIVQSSEDNENSLKAKEDIIIFKVQLLASGKDLSLIPSNFKGLSTISKEPYKNLYRYMYGETQSYEQAQLFKAGATSKGYSTCYIVAYKEGKRIPVPEALKYLSQ